MSEALGRLGDRDQLLARIGSTSAVLGGVAGELRTAAENAAAENAAAENAAEVTSQQIDGGPADIRDDRTAGGDGGLDR